MHNDTTYFNGVIEQTNALQGSDLETAKRMIKHRLK